MTYFLRKQGDCKERSSDWLTPQPIHCMRITFVPHISLQKSTVKQTVTSQSSLNGLSNKPTALLTITRTPWKNPACLNSCRYISVRVHLFSSTLNENRVLLFTLNGTKLSVIVVTARLEVDDHSAVFLEWQFTIKTIMLSQVREEWNLLFT